MDLKHVDIDEFLNSLEKKSKNKYKWYVTSNGNFNQFRCHVIRTNYDGDKVVLDKLMIPLKEDFYYVDHEQMKTRLLIYFFM